MTSRKTVLFGAALVAGAAAVGFAAVQLTSAPEPSPVSVVDTTEGEPDPLAYSPCSVAAPPAQPVDDPLAYSPCSPAPAPASP